MNKNFSEMTTSELKGYLIAHRNDEDAWEELISRSKPSGNPYPPPLDEEGMRIMEQAFRNKFCSSWIQPIKIKVVDKFKKSQKEVLEHLQQALKLKVNTGGAIKLKIKEAMEALNKN